MSINTKISLIKVGIDVYITSKWKKIDAPKVCRNQQYHVEREKQLGGETGYSDAIFFMRTL